MNVRKMKHQNAGSQPSPDLEISRIALDEILTSSLANRQGLAIYLSAQVIHAIFVRRIDDNTIELRNQTSNRVIVRCDRIDAISIP